jgi:hypothetical protein
MITMPLATTAMRSSRLTMSTSRRDDRLVGDGIERRRARDLTVAARVAIERIGMPRSRR